MKKIIHIYIVLCFTAFCLSGCSKGTEPEEDFYYKDSIAPFYNENTPTSALTPKPPNVDTTSWWNSTTIITISVIVLFISLVVYKTLKQNSQKDHPEEFQPSSQDQLEEFQPSSQSGKNQNPQKKRGGVIPPSPMKRHIRRDFRLHNKTLKDFHLHNKTLKDFYRNTTTNSSLTSIEKTIPSAVKSLLWTGAVK
jgi:PBP1b-binding outer membrane lipoprotein LpoB